MSRVTPQQEAIASFWTATKKAGFSHEDLVAGKIVRFRFRGRVHRLDSRTEKDFKTHADYEAATNRRILAAVGLAP